ncbi:hypothetical protein E4A48_16435 [Xanthomonas cerealis pv. cerealis]|uniref:Uncharacterized protein n=1 Tax=Xanthomonas cerealis pv. cerealis TaxID=152263 RepID=A0A514EGA8_9XANT|nr:hypothetical protein E4A48_16435 [Xanthomonas translucens pv. cerealis]
MIAILFFENKVKKGGSGSANLNLKNFLNLIRPGFRRHSRPSLRVAPFKLYRGRSPVERGDAGASGGVDRLVPSALGD